MIQKRLTQNQYCIVNIIFDFDFDVDICLKGYCQLDIKRTSELS